MVRDAVNGDDVEKIAVYGRVDGASVAQGVPGGGRGGAGQPASRGAPADTG